MNVVIESPEIIIAAIILPGLFAVSLLAEGMMKYNRKQGGLIEFVFGAAFLGVIGFSYYFFFR